MPTFIDRGRREEASSAPTNPRETGASRAIMLVGAELASSLFDPSAFPQYPQTLDKPEPATGKVILLGAGPGDPELITLKGLHSLRKADVVIYDRLIPPELLDEVPDSALRVFVGKKAGDYTLAQEEINHLLIFYAQQGHLVVRLKGGDPFVFGRGGEEALALVAAGVPFEVIPGISSAIAVPAAAGIPVTHRGLASSVTIVTGHEQAGVDSTTVDWERLATLGSTLVILMGVEALPYLCQRLLRAGMAADMPAAVIQQGTLSAQRVVTAPVLEIAEEARKAGIKSPSVIVIGEVVAVGDILASFSGYVSPSRASGAQELAQFDKGIQHEIVG